MSNWRPQGWKTAHKSQEFMAEPWDGRLPTVQSIFEAGASAMLEALKKQGKRVHRGQLFDQWGAIPSGWIVHIPEAEA